MTGRRLPGPRIEMTADWGKITAGEIIQSMGGELVSGMAGLILTGISTDSRKMEPGRLFVALKGERYDGHNFVEKAVEGGASAVVIEKGSRIGISEDNGPAVIAVPDTLNALGTLASWWRHQHDVTLAAVTGSAGKTTTKEMTAGILALGAETLKNEGNLNNLIGLPLTLLRLERGHDKAVLEMGMNRPGEIGRLTKIADPDVGLITNVGKAHLEGVGDLMGVARAKVELLEKISNRSHFIINGDDDLLKEEASRIKGGFITYGLRQENVIRADSIRSMGREGMSFNILYQDNCVPVRIKVPGLHNLFNALAAAAVAICMKESFENIVSGLSRFEGIEGRFMTVSLPGGIILVDDTYNSNPSSLKAALDSVKEMADGKMRLIVGLGEMMELGDEAIPAHLEAGAMAAEIGASYLFVMGEHAGEMLTGALEKGFSRKRAVETRSHQEMAQKIEEIAGKDDLILLKGSRETGLEKVSEILKKRIRGNAE
jgi:UDP-N-acetylmuramoyl-tripeptide--D-alanyl-D-alanine ligase